MNPPNTLKPAWSHPCFGSGIKCWGPFGSGGPGVAVLDRHNIGGGRRGCRGPNAGEVSRASMVIHGGVSHEVSRALHPGHDPPWDLGPMSKECGGWPRRGLEGGFGMESCLLWVNVNPSFHGRFSDHVQLVNPMCGNVHMIERRWSLSSQTATRLPKGL
jgi:hypothetical protein